MSTVSPIGRMPRVLWAAPVLAAASALLGGCPIYSADSCSADPNCVSTYPVPDAGPIDTAPAPDATDCGSGCSPGYVCSSIASGRYACTAYDCRAVEKACPADQKCLLNDSGVYTCAVATPPDCAKTGCITGYSCAPGDVGTRICVSTDPNACVVDTDCPAKTGTGSLCLGGVCKAPKDLCSDSTQCKSGGTCLEGRCIPGCAATCATGYSCDTKTNLCTAGAAACDAVKTCTSGLCVAGRCVDKASTDGSCKAGLVSVAGGCLIDDRPVFFCDKDGTKDGTQDVCAASSICLHHNCYVACKDALDTATCASVDKFPVCKSVTSSSGPHFVCGSSTSLGSDCDLTLSPPKTCNPGKVCIDGFCK
jgi:hypothetical protein